MSNSSSEVFLEMGGEFRKTCRAFLLTYSEADQEKFPGCRAFSDCVLEAF